MAIIGMKYPVYGKFTEGDTPSWKDGKVIGKAISCNISIEGGDANVLRADDSDAESDNAFQGGSVEVGVDDLTDEIYGDMLGHKLSEATETEPAIVVANAEDVAPYVGYGFYKTRRKNGVKSFRATLLHKVQFAEPTDETTTRAQTIEWQTPTITGTIMRDSNGDWKTQATFPTEDAARAWLESKLGIQKAAATTTTTEE